VTDLLRRLGISRFDPKTRRGDLYGGLTAAIVALPLALAFGVASGAGPIAGLYGAICVGLFAALFGGTPTQISGPTGPMTIVAASVFTQFAATPTVAFTVVMLCGAFQMLFGALKLGRYVNLMPYPVISGFMTGIGCILILMQLDPLLGYAAPSNVVNALTVLPGDLLRPHWQPLLVGGAAFAICVLTPRAIASRVPPTLLALLGGTALAAIVGATPLLGAVPSGLPALQVPAIDFALLNQMLISAAVLAALGSIDSLLTSLVADNVTRTFHSSDRELIGQGVGNLVAGLFGGIPGAGATIRTLANIKAGGRSARSGVVHGLALLGIALGLGPVVAFIPLAALAGVLLKVGVDVIDWRYLKRAHRMPRADAVCMLIVLVLTVLVDVMTAVAIGVVLSSLLLVKASAEVQADAIRTVAEPEQSLFSDHEAQVFRRCQGRAVVLHLSGLISFAAANNMTRRMALIHSPEVLIIDFVDVSRIDGSAALAIEEIIERAGEAQQEVVLVGLNYSVARLFGELGTLRLIKETHRFATRTEAVEAAERLLVAKDRRAGAPADAGPAPRAS
jgi:SulP family sulfate permease